MTLDRLKPVLISTLFLFFIIERSHAQLEVGDFAFIGVTADPLGDPVELAIVPLADIGSGETIYITDFPWDGMSLQSGASLDGVITWTTTSEITAGTVLNISIPGGGDVNPIGGDLQTFGTVSRSGWTGSAPVAGSGDSWLIFQGTDNVTPTLFIAGFANWDTSAGTNPGEWRTSGAVTLETSFLPDDLTLNITAVGLTTSTFHNDNYVYTGTFIGDKIILLSEIGDRSNWVGNDNTRLDLSAGGANFPGMQPIFLIDTPPNVTLSIDNSMIAEDGGMATITATVSSTVIFDVVVDLAFTGDSEISQDFNVATSITVPANQASASITLTTIDDNLEEADESVIIDIDAITNGNEVTPQQVTTEIQDDDFAPIVQNPLADLDIQAGFGTVEFDLSTIFSDADDVILNFTASSTDLSVATTSINSNTLTITEAGAGTTTISVDANDGSNPPATDSFILNILNTAPVATPPAIPVVNEDDIAVELSDDIQVDDINNDDQVVTFTITGGVLELGTTGIIFGGDGNGSSAFTAEGSLSDINTALDAATFTPDADLNGTAVAGISFTSSDGIVNSNTASITFSISGVNDIPTLTVQSFAYVPNFSDNTVSVLDPITLSVVETVTVGQGPTGVAVSPDGTRVYITNQTDNSVSVINTLNNTVIETISVGQDPNGVAVSLDGTRVYVATDVMASINGRVAVIDALTNTVAANIDVGGDPTNIFVSLDGQSIYVTNMTSDVVSVIDAASEMVLSSITVGDAPVDVASSPDGSVLYVTNSGDNTVSVIDVETETEIMTIPVDPLPFHLSTSPDGLQLYVTNITSGLITVIDVLTNTVTGTIGVGNNPNGISISPEGSVIFVANQSDDDITVIDADDNSILGNIDVGMDPQGFGNMFSRIAISEDDVDRALPVKFSVDDVDNSVLTLMISSTGGTVSIGESGIVFGGNGNGSDSFTGEGTINSINIALDNLLFSAEPNLNGPNAASVSISVSDGIDNSDSETILISIAPVSDPPTVVAGQVFQLDETATNGTLVGTIEELDPDFDAVAQDWTIVSGNPNGDADSEPLFDLNPVTGDLTINDEDDLDFEMLGSSVELTVTVSDGIITSVAEMVTITINDINEVPTISNLAPFNLDENIMEGPLGITLTASDPDSGPNGELTFSITDGNTNNAFGIDPVSGELNVNSTEALNFEVTQNFMLDVTVSDGGMPSLSATVTLDIFINDINDEPTVEIPLDDLLLQSGFVTNTIDLSTVFDDEDMDVLIFDASSSNTANVTVDVMGSTLTISEVANGTSTISVTASDGNGGMVTDDFILIVNASPVLIAEIDDLFLQQGFTGITFELDTIFSDPDGNPLTFTAQSSDESIAFTTILSGFLTVTETGTGTGTVTISLTAEDGNGGMVETDFLLTINAQPEPVNPVEDLILEAGFVSFSIDADTVFSDADGDDIVFSATSDNEDVATVSFLDNILTITEIGNGSTSITINAEDGNGGEGIDSFQLLINSSPLVANALPDVLEQEGFTERTIDLSAVFSDADMDDLTLEVASSDASVVTVSLEAEILTVEEAGTGVSTITVTASDENRGMVQDQFQFVVNGVPFVNQEIEDLLLFEGFGTENVDLSSVFSDPDGNTLEIALFTSNPQVVELELTGNSLTVTEGSIGTTEVTLTADDGNGANVSTVFNIEVAAVLSTIDSPLAALDIFPNPFVDRLNISFGRSLSGTVRIFDVSGNELVLEEISGQSSLEIRVDDLKSGFYLISIETDNGETSRLRIVKD